jgi:hypothetical protein
VQFGRPDVKERPPQLNPARNLALADQIERLAITLKSYDAKTIAAIWRDLDDKYGESLQVAPLQPFDGWERISLDPRQLSWDLTSRLGKPEYWPTQRLAAGANERPLRISEKTVLRSDFSKYCEELRQIM